MRHQAFALREALVLLAVVIISGALVFPYLATRPESEPRSPQSRCANNLKQMMMAALLYSQDNEERFPSAQNSQAGLESPTHWSGLLYPYLGASSLFQCPLDKNDDNIHRSSYGYNKLLSRFPADKLRHPTLSISFFEVDSSLTPSTQTGSSIKDVSAATRHENGANYAFVDGHVKWLKPEAITSSHQYSNEFTFAVE